MGRRAEKIVLTSVFKEEQEEEPGERLTALWLEFILRKERERSAGYCGKDGEPGA